MAQHNVDKLSERQRDCLRLVLRHMQSKEIGRELGISPFTVDNHLKAAIQALGVNSRIEAALILAESEESGPSQRLASQPAMVAPPPISPIMGPSINEDDRRHPEPLARVVREEQVPFTFHPTASPGWKWPVPTAGRRSNDLTMRQRLIWIVILGLLSILAFGAVPGGLYALSRML